MAKHSRLLEVKLTKKEVSEYAEKLAQSCVTRIETEAEKKEVTGNYNAQLKNINKDISALSEAIQNGYEERDVECDERVNGEKNIVEIIRLDTQEVIDARDIEQDDIQENLLEEPKD